MGIRNASLIAFKPKTLSDIVDPTDILPGAMQQLVNLIPHPANDDVWMCRPGSVVANALSTINATGPVSCAIIVGKYLYGLVPSSTNATFDQPFAVDLTTNVLVAVAGFTNANTPLQPSTTGDWTPPTMAVIGTKIIVSHPGFTLASGNYFGVFDISTPGTPTWTAGNTTVNPLVYPPTAVAQFNNRCYYLVNPPTGQPGLYASDALAPTVVTNGTYILTFGDNQTLTAIQGMPLSNQLGGVIQSMMVFKGTTNIYQVTGDPAGGAPGAWTVNTLNVATGTLSPRSIVSTPKGLMFVDHDGLRLIDFNGNVSDVIGYGGHGICTPFQNPTEPTRISCCCDALVLRVSVKTAAGVWNEYWYDIKRDIWSGPHSCASYLGIPYKTTFYMAPTFATTGLYTSDVLQSAASAYTENGVQLTWTWQTSLLPDMKQMAENAFTEATLDMQAALPNGTINGLIATFEVFNEANTQLGLYNLLGSAPQWGTAVWGAFTWGGMVSGYRPIALYFATPIVTRRSSFLATGNSVSGLLVGDLMVRQETLGYLQQ